MQQLPHNFELLATHGGKWHADDVLGRCLTLYLGFPGQFVRLQEKPSAALLNNTRALIWDIGLEYNPILNNFDHHQDGNLPCACVLMLRHFYPAGAVRDFVENKLFTYVSHVDTGRIVEQSGHEYTVPTFNSVIRALNYLGDFDKAVQVALPILESTFIHAKVFAKEEEIWKRFVMVRNRVAFYDGDNPITTWRDLGIKYGADVLICIDPRSKNGWRLEVRDTALATIPRGVGERWRHESGFLAVFDDVRQAVDIGQMLGEHIIRTGDEYKRALRS